MKFIILFAIVLTPAFAADEPQTFLKKCFRKDYANAKFVQTITFALSENLSGDEYGEVEVKLKDPNGPTAGRFMAACTEANGTLTCTGKDGGKFTFKDEGDNGLFKIEEELKLRTMNEVFPGKTTSTKLPVNEGITMAKGIPHACEKLVP